MVIMHDAAGDNFRQNHPFDDAGLLTKRAFNGRIPGLSVAVVVAIAASGKNAATAATGSATGDFQGFLLLKTRDIKDGLVFQNSRALNIASIHNLIQHFLYQKRMYTLVENHI